MSDLVKQLRRAFDADSVAEKNLAIRAAYDFIAAMQADAAPVAHCGDADVPLCSACSVPIVELVQQPGCGAPMSVTDAAPVAWMHDDGDGQLALSFSQSHAKWPYWTETPLYAHPPVDDRVTTTKPVVAHETGNTSDKLANLKTAADKLAGYAGHDDDCQIMKHGVWSDPIPCTCGYTDAWWAYEAAKQL